MDDSVIRKINRHVARKFPELASAKPTVRPQGGGEQQPRFLLTYSGKAKLPGGRSMARVVRVVADESGRILRLTTSK